MSFSSEVKDELARALPEEAELRRAELAGMLLIGGRYVRGTGVPSLLSLSSEHAGTVRKYFTLLKKTYKINGDLSAVSRSARGRSHLYSLSLEGEENIGRVLRNSGLGISKKSGDTGVLLPPCGKAGRAEEIRALLRGAFLAGGSLSDPERFYHLEFVCQTAEQAAFLKDALAHSGVVPGVVERKRLHIVYFKGGDEIADLLGMMEAPGALMELENIRIVKEMRNSVNRKVNCEAANISKTVGAAVRQLEDIAYIRDTEGLDTLPGALLEMAEVRLRYPEASLKELGEHLNPAVGKSGVNHRLRKLSEYAESLRGAKGQIRDL